MHDAYRPLLSRNHAFHTPSFDYRYIIKVVTTTETYNVFRRYSRFHDLSKRMSLRVPLPAKGSYFMRSTSTNTERVKKRMEGLDQWIAEVFQTLKTQRREIDRLSFDESKQLIGNIGLVMGFLDREESDGGIGGMGGGGGRGGSSVGSRSVTSRSASVVSDSGSYTGDLSEGESQGGGGDASVDDLTDFALDHNLVEHCASVKSDAMVGDLEEGNRAGEERKEKRRERRGWSDAYYEMPVFVIAYVAP
jgi:hypothetical protein